MDHKGCNVEVKGLLLNGVLTGPGEYVDPHGNKFVEAWFYKDKKHGKIRVEHANGSTTVATLYNGVYHGPKTFYKHDKG